MALALVAGCTASSEDNGSDGASTGASSSDDGSDSESGTTAAAEESSGDEGGESSGDVCGNRPEGEYADCTDGQYCGASANCAVGPADMPAEWGVCTRGCREDCHCWAAPSGTAVPQCRGATETVSGSCVLSCLDGATCPDGMMCVEELMICAFEDTTPDETDTDGDTEG